MQLARITLHLDYAAHFWFPYYRMYSNIGKFKLLNLNSLERRTARGDLIEVYKWFRDYYKGAVGKTLVVTNEEGARRNEFK